MNRWLARQKCSGMNVGQTLWAGQKTGHSGAWTSLSGHRPTQLWAGGEGSLWLIYTQDCSQVGRGWQGVKCVKPARHGGWGKHLSVGMQWRPAI